MNTIVYPSRGRHDDTMRYVLKEEVEKEKEERIRGSVLELFPDRGGVGGGKRRAGGGGSDAAAAADDDASGGAAGGGSSGTGTAAAASATSATATAAAAAAAVGDGARGGGGGAAAAGGTTAADRDASIVAVGIEKETIPHARRRGNIPNQKGVGDAGVARSTSVGPNDNT
ncbi:hypothetical protein HZH68_013798 [Vespula germanica]|uniref:Uncharacterized protein n=1 Tax=Vespula germanica TaxID=30212 RepID=A0A834MW92_VESGE|nr:hypothetical protein HZH68_013798 [Vespula germanica]